MLVYVKSLQEATSCNMVTEPDGTEYSQIQVFTSLDGWPLAKGQVRTFRFVLDREPGEGVKAGAYIVDLELE